MVINKALEQGELTVREKSVRIQGIVKEKSGKFDLCVGFELGPVVVFFFCSQVYCDDIDS